MDWKLALIVAGLAVSSCQSVPPPETTEGEEKKEQKASEASVRVVGEVVSIHADGGFVLIRRFGGGSLPTDGVLTSVGQGGQSSVLKPTGERIGRFYAADVSGSLPAMGDLVLARKLPDSGLQVSPEALEGAL